VALKNACRLCIQVKRVLFFVFNEVKFEYADKFWRSLVSDLMASRSKNFADKLTGVQVFVADVPHMRIILPA
jgi:hypothetical protein